MSPSVVENAPVPELYEIPVLPENIPLIFAESTCISFALAVIPLPPITFKVLVAAIVPPPVRPVPAVTLTPL